MSPPTRAGPIFRCPAASSKCSAASSAWQALQPRPTKRAKGRTEREVVPPTRILDGFGAFGPPTAPHGRCRSATSPAPRADHPPGFYGPPEGLLAVNTLAPADRLVGDRLRTAARAARGLSDRRAAGSARSGAGRGAGAAGARCAGGVLPRWRDWPDPAQAAAAGGGDAGVCRRDHGADVRIAGLSQDNAQQQRRPNAPPQAIAPPASSQPADADSPCERPSRHASPM